MLKNGDAFFYIVEEQGNKQPAGQIRFKIENKEAVISMSLSRSIRGKGYAGMLIEKASSRMLAESSAELIHAYIQHDNEASIRCFSKAGYEELKDTEDRLHFILRRNR
jgi:RimJ/RimL family protein N-acetyltransferase